MRTELVYQRGWVPLDEYTRLWQLSKLSLGIQQVAQVILYGRRLGGRRGIALAICGFLLPSVVLTIILSIVLVAVIDNRLIDDALELVIPLTGGMTMAVALQMWNPSWPGKFQNQLRLLGQGCLVILCALLVGVVKVPVPLVMLGALVAGALLPR